MWRGPGVTPCRLSADNNHKSEKPTDLPTVLPLLSRSCGGAVGSKGTVPNVPATPVTPVWSLSLVLEDSRRRCCGLDVKFPQEAPRV